MIEFRALQQYLYCPHRWGLRYLYGEWEDNAYTIIADLMHERVHSGQTLQRTAQKIAFGNVYLYSEKYGIYGRADNLELHLNANGVHIPGLPQRYHVCIVEYKPTETKEERMTVADRMQVYAQYVCARELFGESVRAYLYYGNTRKRKELVFDKNDDAMLISLVSRINEWMHSGTVPLAEYGNHCNGCSLKDRCMPKVKEISVRNEILKGIK